MILKALEKIIVQSIKNLKDVNILHTLMNFKCYWVMSIEIH